MPREHFQVLFNAMDDFSGLLFVHGTRYRHGEVVAKGYHDFDALAVELPAPDPAPEAPAPKVMPLGSAGETQ